jgi:hypothetical protein
MGSQKVTSFAGDDEGLREQLAFRFSVQAEFNGQNPSPAHVQTDQTNFFAS